MTPGDLNRTVRQWLHPPNPGEPGPPDPVDERRRMVREQLDCHARGITNPRVLQAMAAVPRHEFVPCSEAASAYEDHPLPIGLGQTISQPYIVALMTQALDPQPEDRVLEIGTGSGYQAAVLAGLVGQVYTIEIIPELAARSEKALQNTGIRNVFHRIGDGHEGWPEAAPYNGILVTCAARTVPGALLSQLADSGRMVLPVGPSDAGQELVMFERHGNKLTRSVLLWVKFVPMTGGPC